LMDSEISPQNNDILLQIASLIRLAEGFRLGFVKCNQPVQCRQMASRLKEMLASEAKIINVELKEPVSSLRRAVLQALESDKSDNAGKRAIMVFGFEHSLPSEGPALALDELNQSRENFPKSFSDPVFIWLPDYALTRMAREAPDFWGWRSGVFEFYPELRLMTSIEKTVTHDAVADSLSLDEKRVRAAALEGLIGDYYELQRGKRENQALAAVLHSLGNLRYQFGKYDVANKLYQESLRIKQDLGDNKGISASLHQLGRLAQDTGDLAEARRLYQESLEISQELGDKSGISASLHQLGMLAEDTGDLAEARKFYLESLKIFQELGDKSGVSKSLHQLGNLACITGDLAEARRLYQESMKISQELGDKNGLAITSAQLALLDEKECNMNSALELIRLAESIFVDLKSPMAAQAQNDRERLEMKSR